MAYQHDFRSRRPSVRNRSAEKVSFGARASRGSVSTFRPDGPDLIFIPKKARGLRLIRFAMSARLLRFLQAQDIEWLGDLHGKSFSRLAQHRNGGRKTLLGLQALVRSAQRGHQPPQMAPAPDPAMGRQEWGCFFVPKDAYDLNPFDLPSSVRLEGALRKQRATRLGDLDGVPFGEFLRLGNCGKTTVAELVHLLERVAAGQFQPANEPFSWSDASELLASLDQFLDRLPARARTLLLLRLGGKSERKVTLRSAGSRWGLTRERVRQIVELSLLAVKREGGPRLLAQLAGLASLCQKMVCPLTCDLLSLWLRKSRGTHKFPLPFYVRLLGELSSEIPAWPKGQEPSLRPPARRDTFFAPLEDVLCEGNAAISLKKAFQTMRNRPGGRDLNPVRLLAALKHATTVAVQFPAPDRPEVNLKPLPPATVAAAVLKRSGTPLTPEEITSRAEARFGKGRLRWDARTLANFLTPAKGFYLLGARTYGMARHFRFPKTAWPNARMGVKRLLEKEGRPMSTLEILKQSRCEWTEQVDAYELAQVLRGGYQFVDLGNLRFALAS